MSTKTITKTLAQKNVFYIPAGIPFVSALAQAVLSGNLPQSGGPKPQAQQLPLWTILLPTRRATRALMQAFIDGGDKTAHLLPSIQPLGDVDEDQLALSDVSWKTGLEPIPNSINGIERQFILYSLIHDWVNQNNNNPLAKMLDASSIHAFDLARSLGTLVDSFETNQVDLKVIEELFDGEFSEHREQILEFLSIVQKQLPIKMAALKKIGASDHRNRLMQAYKGFLERDTSDQPIIAAGSTGSIPATAELLSCIANLEHGAVVLPGLDKDLDNDSWANLPENHPQFGMRELLAKFGIDRDDVAILPGIEEQNTYDSPLWRAQNWLASEIMRPAETTDQWRKAVTDHRQTLCTATTNITLLEADDQRCQALTIALVMRHGLETDKSVALITPDRQLARSVKAELGRWEIEIDDSAGKPLLHSANAIFLSLLLEAAKEKFSPVTLKALLAHPFACFGISHTDQREVFTNFDLALLRADTPYSGLSGLYELGISLSENIKEKTHAHPSVKRLDQKQWQAIIALSKSMQATLEPLAELFDKNSPGLFSGHIKVHIQAAEDACMQNDKPSVLWQGDEGEKLSEMFSTLMAAATLAPALTARDYSMVLDQQMSESIIRPKHVKHPTLAIFGLLEARLISTDVMILGGLNETVWPPISETDPWLTRPQLRNAGLPVPERRIGLAAHDFAQGFCASQVYLSYTKKLGNGPAVPSRWILRLKALLEAADMAEACKPLDKTPWVSWARELDRPQSFKPSKRPAPKPPVKIRPTTLSVTGIDALIKNPYAFYADKILRLKPLNLLEKQIGAAERGILVHQALQNFIETHHEHLPKNASLELQDEFQNLLEETISNTSLKVFWRPQFVRMADWFVEQERQLRENWLSSAVEVSGQYSFSIADQLYKLTARADRLDTLDNQTYRIIDYKTGAPPSFDETAKAFSPQLLLEALIASKGGFEHSKSLPVSALIYVKLSGGVPAGDFKTAPGKKKIALEEMVHNAGSGMTTLLAAYQRNEQAYMANPESEQVKVEREYDYLSRWREWAHLLSNSSDRSDRGGGSLNE